jgi:hypothetical protein
MVNCSFGYILVGEHILCSMQQESEVLQSVGLCSFVLRYPSANEYIYQSMWVVCYWDKMVHPCGLLIHLAPTVCSNQWLFYIKRHSFLYAKDWLAIFPENIGKQGVLQVMCEMYVKQVGKKNCQWLMWIKLFSETISTLKKKTGIKGFTTAWSFHLKTLLLSIVPPIIYSL